MDSKVVVAQEFSLSKISLEIDSKVVAPTIWP